MAQKSIDLFSLLPTSHNYYSGVIQSIPSIMASERLNLPPVPSVARITQPANEDTAQRDERQCNEGDRRTTMTPARRGRRSHRDKGDDASGIVGARGRCRALVGGRGVARAGGQRRQALKGK